MLRRRLRFLFADESVPICCVCFGWLRCAYLVFCALFRPTYIEKETEYEIRNGSSRALCFTLQLRCCWKSDFKLPNGLEVWGFAEFDILAVYYVRFSCASGFKFSGSLPVLILQEMFEEQQYFKHGITLQENDTVLDIGANTGIFTVYLVLEFLSTWQL